VQCIYIQIVNWIYAGNIFYIQVILKWTCSGNYAWLHDCFSICQHSLHRESRSHLPVPVASALPLLSEEVMEWPWVDGALWCMLRYTAGTSSTCIIPPPVVIPPPTHTHTFSFLSLHQNGSYVLPMLWWDSPLKLFCPVQTSTPAPAVSNSALSVVCSSDGIAVEINGLKQDIQILGVIGIWVLLGE